ncbi:MAG: hypothetical protein VX294_14935 [Candidatus Latescibacterota bacterium]|nr:hypothetical protein [Candidatus Latescibacterota bacterium]
MKFVISWLLLISFVGNWEVHAQPINLERVDTRLYLFDGSIVEGHLMEKDNDLVIIRVEKKIFTFEYEEIEKIVTLESLGAGAKTISVKEYPYISFLGGAIACGLMSWLQFDRASDADAEAKLNKTFVGTQISGRVKQLEDRAGRARVYGWASAALSVGSLGISLISREETKRVFPKIGSTTYGTPTVGAMYRF